MTFFVFDGPSATLPSLSGPESSNCFRDGRAPVKNHRLNVEKLGFCFSLGEKLRLARHANNHQVTVTGTLAKDKDKDVLKASGLTMIAVCK